ncbi:MAG: hypothetical protein ACRDTJ_22605 [Pseudonocardiaceae bacterium]
MSTEQIIAWRVRCDIAGCDNATEAADGPELADEDAIEAGWHLSEAYGRDMCPTHAKEPTC